MGQPENLGNNSIMVPYNGKQLNPGMEYFWKVKVWNKNNLPSTWSKTSSFCTGLEIQAWKNAKWIGYEELHDSMRVVPGTCTLRPRLKNKALNVL